MDNKIKIGIIILAISGISLAGWYIWNLQKVNNIEDMNNCNSDSDCIIVSSGYCGGASAINLNYLNVWNKYLEEESARNQGVFCKPTEPLDSFKAKCINNKCSAI